MEKRKGSDEEKNDDTPKKNDAGAEEEELKGVDLEKIAKENVFVPTLFEDDNFDFVVSNP